MQDVGITSKELLKIQTVIQGFNLEGQHAIGMIHVKLEMGNLSTSSIFHVIDTKTSCRLLLRRPWLHEHRIAAFHSVSMFEILLRRGKEDKQ